MGNVDNVAWGSTHQADMVASTDLPTGEERTLDGISFLEGLRKRASSDNAVADLGMWVRTLERHLDRYSNASGDEERAANLYAAMDHAFMYMASLTERIGQMEVYLSQMGSGISGEDAFNVRSQLDKLNAYSGQVLKLEKELKARGYSLDFSRPVEDVSWSSNPHWGSKENFRDYFMGASVKVRESMSTCVPHDPEAISCAGQVTWREYLKEQNGQNIVALADRLLQAYR